MEIGNAKINGNGNYPEQIKGRSTGRIILFVLYIISHAQSKETIPVPQSNYTICEVPSVVSRK